MCVYVGVSNKSKRIKKIYVGVNGIAKEVNAVYVGNAQGKSKLITEKINITFQVTNYYSARIYSENKVFIGYVRENNPLTITTYSGTKFIICCNDYPFNPPNSVDFVNQESGISTTLIPTREDIYIRDSQQYYRGNEYLYEDSGTSTIYTS